MSEKLAAVEALRRAAAAAAASGDPDLCWLAARCRLVLAGDVKSFEVAFGLETTQSQRSWRTMAIMSERDRLIAQMATRFPGKANQKALLVSKLLRRYAATGWVADRHKAEMPADYSGTVKELAFRAFRLGPVPTGSRRIFDIIKDCSEHAGLIATDTA